MGFKNPALIVVLLLVIIVLFGSSKLPDVARAVGQSMKILKKDVKDLRDDGSTPQQPPAQAQPPAADVPPTAAAPSTTASTAAAGQSTTTPAPQAEPRQEPTTPATPDVVEGDDSKS